MAINSSSASRKAHKWVAELSTNLHLTFPIHTEMKGSGEMARKQINTSDKISQIVNGIVFDENFEDEVVSKGMMQYLKNNYQLSDSDLKEIIELVFGIKKIIERRNKLDEG